MKFNTYDLSNVASSYIKRDTEELNRMYPNECLEGKYILFVEAALWFPYIVEDIEASIDFSFDNEVKTFKHKIRTPYPNKYIRVISLMIGRKVSSMGIPMIFNSIDEVKKLSKVSIKWRVKSKAENDKDITCYVHALYDVKLDIEEGKRFYSIYSKDCLLDSFTEEDNQLKYLNEFDRVIAIKDDGNSEFSIHDIKNNIQSKNTLEVEAFVAMMENMDMKDLIDTCKNEKNIIIYQYYANETLKPDLFAANIH